VHNDSWDDEGAFSDESFCMECGGMNYRESSVPGLCYGCLNGDFDLDVDDVVELSYDQSDGFDFDLDFLSGPGLLD